jgi:hypothetical protein
MNQLLQKLAHAFERYVPLKLTMAERYRGPLFRGGEVRDELLRLGYKDFWHSPYTRGRNDLECYMSGAWDCVGELDTAGFKRQREMVVKQLQPNYRRIVTAAETLDHYLERQNISDFIYLGVRTRHDEKRNAAKLVILIEYYAAAFQREQNLETQALFRLEKKEYDKVYQSMPREMLLADLNRLLEHWNYVEFCKAVVAIRKDMHTQLREIKEAWESLFNYDVYDERFCAYDFGDCNVKFDMGKDKKAYSSI